MKRGEVLNVVFLVAGIAMGGVAMVIMPPSREEGTSPTLEAKIESEPKVALPKAAPKEEHKVNEQAEKVLALVRAAKLPNLGALSLFFGKVRVSPGVSDDKLSVSVLLEDSSWANLSDSWDDATKRIVLAAVNAKFKELQDIRDNGDTRKGAVILMATEP